MHDGFYLILNPRAGGGAALRALRTVLPLFRASGRAMEVGETRSDGHAVELAAAAAGAGWSAVVAIGGDGTVHQVANGLLSANPSPPLGIIPAGSGNDFALAAGVPARPLAAAQAILSGRERRVDVGRVGERWFTNGVGVGLDARVGIEANRNRRLRGMAIYLWALARVLPRYRAPTVRVEVDGRELIHAPLTLVTVGNGARHGGAFWLSPSARVDDGVLDLCACEALSIPRILGFLPLTLRGTHVGAACVRTGTGRRVRISSADPLPVHVDGETYAEDAHLLEIEVHPGRLRLLG
jgi:diacylglycerol kinase (ATP)